MSRMLLVNTKMRTNQPASNQGICTMTSHLSFHFRISQPFQLGFWCCKKQSCSNPSVQLKYIESTKQPSQVVREKSISFCPAINSFFTNLHLRNLNLKLNLSLAQLSHSLFSFLTRGTSIRIFLYYHHFFN